MPRTRRSLLALGGGALAGLAGCLGGVPGTDGTSTTPTQTTTTRTTTTTTSDEPTTPDDPTTEPALYTFGTAGTVDGLTITPTAPQPQSSLLSLSTADQMAVTDPDGRRLLFVDVAVETEGTNAPIPSAFRLAAGGETYPGWTTYDRTRGPSLAPDGRRGQQYTTDEPAGWVGFELPVGLDADEVRLTLDRQGAPAWLLPDPATARLQAPEPTFTVESVTVPETADSFDAIPFGITVTNTGDAAGTFRFVVNYQGPTYMPAPQRLDLAAGETREWETTLDPYGSGDRLRLAVTTAERDWEYTVAVTGSDA